MARRIGFIRVCDLTTPRQRMGAPKNLQCPRCGSLGYGTREKRVKKYHYNYFGHRVKKSSGKWSIRWCYLGKPDLGNRLGNIKQTQHSFDKDFRSTIPEMSVKPAFDRHFESSKGGFKRSRCRCGGWDSNPRDLTVTDLAGLCLNVL